MSAAGSVNKKVALMARSPLTLYGLTHFYREINKTADIRLQSSTLHEVFPKLKLQPVDVLITDIRGIDETVTQGIRIIKTLCQHFPTLSIIIYSRQHPREVLQMLREHPRMSFITRDEPLPQAAELFRRALAGGRVYSPQIAELLAKTNWKDPVRLDALTQRENDVLMCLFNGLTISQIARLRVRSIKTVSTHKCNAMRKLGVENDSGLFLLREKIIDHYVDAVPFNECTRVT